MKRMGKVGGGKTGFKVRVEQISSHGANSEEKKSSKGGMRASKQGKRKRWRGY